ncbi:WD repeat-containing protein [Echinococcus granulosus]|uniref:Cilia- and flagella-associated protein 43 n=1 Tax=Echinococcus granulosus TaxID=6210 RepID=W6UKM8_ECHGR|nr:WD repeat-containing protein [Echinococcus granulosus]EUB61638.1 WD repeat-containing protein [Echinococcus granulosus]
MSAWRHIYYVRRSEAAAVLDQEPCHQAAIFSKRKSIFNFGTCSERKTFANKTVPSRLGILYPIRNEYPNLGPGTYNMEPTICITDVVIRSAGLRRNVKAEERWTQSVSNNAVHFINNQTICLKSGNYLRFSSTNGDSLEYHYNGANETVLATHPIHPVLALAETNISAGKVVLIYFPDFQTKFIGRARNTQVLHLTFSHQNLLACITSIRENTLAIWNYVKAELLIEAQLNFVCPDIFGFCPINENKIVGATERHIYAWTLESYGENHHLSCSETAVPRTDARIGFYEDPQDNLPLELIEQEENPTIYQPMREVVSGVLREAHDELQNYKDNAKRMKSISLTWTKEGFAVFGCRDGNLFMVDLDSMATGVIFSPNSLSADVANKEQEAKEASMVLKAGDVDNLIYTMDGILCGGADGRLRYLDWSKTRNADLPPVGLVAPTSLANQNLSSSFLSTIQQIALSKMNFLDEEVFATLKSDHNSIVHISACPNYQNFAILRKSGLVQVFQQNFNTEPIPNFSFKSVKEMRTNVSSFTGICGINIEDDPYFVTCNANGQVVLWRAETGEQTCCLEFASAATCMKAIPGLPLTAIGLQSGVLYVVYWVDRCTPRIMPAHQIFQSAIEDIYVDEKGDVLLVTGSEPNIYVISCEPRKEFQPIGYITHENKIDSIAFARVHGDKIYCIILDKRKKSDRYTTATFFTLTDEILDDPTGHIYQNSYQLRDESLSMMSFKILLNISSAYLTVTDPNKKKNLSADESASMNSYKTPKEEAENPENEELKEEAKTTPKIILYSLTKGTNNSCVLVMIDLSKEIADQTSAYRQFTRSAQHQRRTYSITRDFSSRLQPFLQARSNDRRSILGSASFEALSYRVPRPSINFQLSRLRREDKRDKKPKKEVYCVPVDSVLTKPTVTGVDTFLLTNITFFYSSVSLCTTHVPGIIIATTQGGVFYVLKVDDLSASVIGYFPLVESTSDPIEVAVTRDFGILAAVKRDGGYCAMNLSDKIPPIDEADLLALERDAETKRTALMIHESWEVNSSNDRSPNDSLVKNNLAIGTDEEFKVYKIDQKVSPVTWIEKQYQKQHAKDVEAMKGTKTRIIEEFSQIKKELEKMAEMNDGLTDLEKVAITEFELDSEERNAILEETNNMLQKKRAEIEHEDLIKDFTHSVIKSRCWEMQEVKGRSLLAYDLPIEVSNYPLCPRTQEENRLIDQAKSRRRVEIAVGEFYRKENEKIYKKTSSSESEKGSSEEMVEDEVTSESAEDHLGSAATRFGISTKLLYNQMELFTNDQKLTQAVLIQDLIRKMRSRFNAEFDECLARKRQYIEGIRKRVERINEIIPKLDPNAPLLSMRQYELQPVEEAEKLLECTDEEVDVKRYRSPEEIAEMEAVARLEAERLRQEQLDNWRERGLEDMMGGVLEVRREDELKKDIPTPAAVKAGKQEHEMNAEEKKIYRSYLQACKELEEEREKYRKYLEAEMNKNEASIEETKLTINKDVVNLFHTYLRYEIGIEMEELKVRKLRASILQARELENEAKLYSQTKTHIESKVSKLNSIIQQAKELIERLQEDVELITVEDRMMDKSFRKEFHDIHGPAYDIIYKAFKRRPKRLAVEIRSGMEEEEREDGKEESRKKMSSLLTQASLSGNRNPYTEALTQRRSLEAEWAAVQRALSEYDEINKMAEFNIDPAIWERLSKARLKKVTKEMELKNATYHLNSTTTFLQRREKELADAMQELDEVEMARSELKAKIYRMMANVDINILMPQGQVEIEVKPGRLVEDFNTCLLINRKQIEDLNAQVVQLSNEKINHMELIKSYKRRFKMLEWWVYLFLILQTELYACVDLREMLMRYEDLVDRKKQITNFTITREIQRYLQNPDYENLVSTELTNSEHTYAQLKANHGKHIDKIEKRIKYFKEKQVRKIKKRNEKLLLNLEQMNISVLEARQVYEQTPYATSDVLRAEACYNSLLRRANLDKLALQQTRELQSLRNELKQLHKTNFPAIPY